jgi:hypothetical protein
VKELTGDPEGIGLDDGHTDSLHDAGRFVYILQ